MMYFRHINENIKYPITRWKDVVDMINPEHDWLLEYWYLSNKTQKYIFLVMLRECHRSKNYNPIGFIYSNINPPFESEYKKNIRHSDGRIQKSR